MCSFLKILEIIFFSRLQTVDLRRFPEFLSSLMINVIILSLISLMC